MTSDNATMSLSEQEAADRAEYLDGLSDLLDYLREHPEMIPTWGPIDVSEFFYEAEDVSRLIDATRTGGTWEKTTTDYEYSVRRRFGPHTFRRSVARSSVCKRIQVGEKVIEAREATTVPIYEFECPPSLLAKGF